MKFVYGLFSLLIGGAAFQTPASAKDLAFTCIPALICQKGQCLEGDKAREAAGDVKITIPTASPSEISVAFGGNELRFERLGTNGVYVQKKDKNFILFFEDFEFGGSFSVQFLGRSGSDWLEKDGFSKTRIAGACNEAKLAD